MFGRPWMLLLLVVPLLHLVWVWRRQRGRIVLPFDYGLRGSGWPLRGLLGIGESVPALLLAVAVLVLSQPHELAAPRQKRALTNIQILVDISGSMAAKFGAGTRYDVSMKAIERFLTYRQGDAFGLTFFGNNYVHWVPLTSDPSAVRNASKFMGPSNNVPGFGGTEIGKAVLACREVLVERSEGDRMLILVTDGFSSDLGGGNEIAIAKKLRRDGIKLFASSSAGVAMICCWFIQSSFSGLKAEADWLTSAISKYRIISSIVNTSLSPCDQPSLTR